MMRAARFLVGLLMYFSVATVIAEGIIVACAVQAWEIDREKVAEMLAVARGVPRAPHPAPPPEPKEPAEQVSYEQVLAERALRDKNLQFREQTLAASLAQLNLGQQRLADDRKKLDRQRTDYQAELAAAKDKYSSEGMGEAQRILQNLKPKQAKEILVQMLEDKEIREVVALLAGMTEGKRAKILGEFKTPEEAKKVEEVLRLIREGDPGASIAGKAREQFKERPGGS